MGRYVGRILRTFAGDSAIDLTLVVRDRAAARRDAALVPAAGVVSIRRARRMPFDAVWYPWNGVRFTLRAPSVVTVNDDFAFRFPARGIIARRREQAPIRRAIATATHLTTISRWSQVTLARRFALDAEGVLVLPLHADPFFTPGAPLGAAPFVLAVGAGDPRKNVALLVDAHALAFPRGDVPLVVVGRLARNERALAARRGILLDERTGVDDATLRDLYRSARVVAVPSLAEGFGLVAAEAMACGAAVLASANSALRETVGTAGMLVDPDDVDAWSLALRELWFDAGRREAYRAQALGRSRARDGDAAATALLALLTHVLNDRA